MGKKIAGVLAVAAVLMSIAAVSKIRETGFGKPLPDADYLSNAEAELRPLYQKLSEKEKAVYTALLRGAEAGENNIELPYEVDGDTYSKIYCMLEKQEFALFYLDSTYFNAEKVREATVNHRFSEPTDSKEILLEEAAERAMTEAVGANYAAGASGSDFAKALALHDYIARKCTYTISTEDGLAGTAYGCLVSGKANCEGYAKAYGYLLREAGIECTLVTGVTSDGVNHAWNQMKIDGEWYNTDVTWDDSDKDEGYRHAYFLCDDDAFYRTHTTDGEQETFSCKSDKSNYYKKSDLYADSCEEAERILVREFSSGTKYIELKFADGELLSQFMADYLKDKKIFDIVMANGNYVDGSTVTINSKEVDGENCLILWLG